MVSRAKTTETELKIPAVVGKGQDRDMFSAEPDEVFPVGMAEENPEH